MVVRGWDPICIHVVALGLCTPPLRRDGKDGDALPQLEVVKRLGINKRVSWYTFRRTYSTLLQANREDVKVVQELLPHGSTKGHWTSMLRHRCLPNERYSERSYR
jgi:integrase